MNCEMEANSTYAYSSPLGTILLESNKDHLLSAGFKDDAATVDNNPNSVIHETILQLDDYFAGKRLDFDIPLSPSGTAFQQQVWQELLKIPYGITITYLQLAKRLGNVKSIRAAASANGKNPLAIIIPCHRVVGAGGQLTGYAGGLHRKKWLLEHEGKFSGNPGLF